MNSAELSSLQGYLADMNNDGAINAFDLTLLQQEMLSQSGEESSDVLSTYIPELECTIEEYIYSEYGNEGIEYAEELLV